MTWKMDLIYKSSTDVSLYFEKYVHFKYNEILFILVLEVVTKFLLSIEYMLHNIMM